MPLKTTATAAWLDRNWGAAVRTVKWFAPVLLGTAATVALAARIPSVGWLPSPSGFKETYLAEFAGILTYVAVSASVGIWQLADVEQRFGDAVSDIDAWFARLPPEVRRHAVAASVEHYVEGLSALDPASFDERVFKEYMKALYGAPDVASYLRGAPQDFIKRETWKVPYFARRWLLLRAQAGTALAWAVYAACTVLTFALMGASFERAPCAWFSLLVVLLGIHPLVRIFPYSVPASARRLGPQGAFID